MLADAIAGLVKQRRVSRLLTLLLPQQRDSPKHVRVAACFTSEALLIPNAQLEASDDEPVCSSIGPSKY